MRKPPSDNLSETLFTNHKQARETSSLIPYMPSSEARLAQRQDSQSWYRQLRPTQWFWQGVEPLEYKALMASIAASTGSRTHDHWLDTVMGYRSGNWTFEWTRLAMKYQQKAHELTGDAAAEALFRASLHYSLAGYPHLKNDNLAIQSHALATASYLEAAKHSRYKIKAVDFQYKNKKIQGYLHLPHSDEPLPTVIVATGLDTLQTDMWALFRDHFAPKNMAMLTLDMPSIGHSKQWPLSEDSSCLHQAVLSQLAALPWVDHYRVGLLGFRFGGNAMVRLAFIEQNNIKACVALGAPIHQVFIDEEKIRSMDKMYLDILASRIGRLPVDIDSLTKRMRAWSLKVQGILSGRKCNVPILALSLPGDTISPASDNQMIALYSRQGKTKKITKKSITQGYDQALKMSLEWLTEHLQEQS